MTMLKTLLIAEECGGRPSIEFKEQCWLILGIKTERHYLGILSYQGEGGFAHVDFDWRKASDKNILGFFHTHPSGLETPSIRDDRTMGALVRAEGRPLLCGIITDKSKHCFLYHRESDRTDSGLRDKLAKKSTAIGNTYLKGVRLFNILGLKIFIAKRY